MGAAWASGINLYATIFMLGILGGQGYIALPPELEVISNPLVLAAAGFMYCVEFFADKIPGVDSAWDAIHTFIRIPAGAILAMAAVGDNTATIELTAFLLGGTLAAGTHATKAGSRLLIQASPEPVSNWLSSITEDIMVIIGLWTALYYPWVFIVAMILFIALMIWMLPRTCRAIHNMGSYLRRLFTGTPGNKTGNI